MNNEGSVKTKVMVRIAVLGAIAFVLMYLEFPLPFLPVFLKFDFGDVPTLIAGFTMGPAAGFLSQAVKAVIFFLSGKGDAGIIGVTANLAAGGSMTVAASIFYHRWGKRRNVWGALIFGTIVMVVVTTLANIYIFLPIYGIPAEQILPLVYAGTIPFNIIKGIFTSIATVFLFSRFKKIIQS